jgi:hypothetical protein
MELYFGSRVSVEPVVSRRHARITPATKIGRIILRNSYTLGLTACALFVAVSSAASAADIAIGNYSVSGFTTSSTCTIAGTPKKGTASDSTVVYPGAGKAGMILANPATTSTTKAGGGDTEVCVAAGKVPAAGLNGATIAFNCYEDTEAGPAKTVLAKLSAKFKVGASHSPQVSTVEVATTITSPISCKFTSEGTYSHN